MKKRDQYGYFDDRAKEYVLQDMFPRRDFLNYLWNDSTVCALTQFGDGNSWSLIGKDRRQIDMGERLVYIKDRKDGSFYSANRNYQKEKFDAWETHVGLGYHRIISRNRGIETVVTFLVPPQGRELKLEVRVKNLRLEPAELDLYTVVKPCASLAGHGYGEASRATDFLGLSYSYLGYRIAEPYTHMYLASSQEFVAFDVNEENFRGHYSGFDHPEALQRDLLSCQGTDFEMRWIGALQYRFHLAPGEEFAVVNALGIARNEEENARLASETLKVPFEEERLACLQRAEKGFDRFEIRSDDPILDSQTNIWLKRQLSLGKDWGRLYGKGFRDVTQDVTAFSPLDPEKARERILSVLAHVYEDGCPIRMYEPEFHYPYNDGGSWVPTAVLTYINESGDLSILEEKVPYLKGTMMEHASYADGFVSEEYSGTDYQDTVFDHLTRIMDYLDSSRGKRGLVLFLGGDWNDSLNAVGLKGVGESVWLSIATVKALEDYRRIALLSHHEREAEIASSRKEELKRNILRHGEVDGALVYGFTDSGEVLGGKTANGPHYYLNPQTWAVIASIAPKEKLEQYMDVVEKELSCPFGYVQCAPSYTEGRDDIGRVSYLKPGIVENGSVYNHGVAFKIFADCLLKRKDIAYQTLRKIRYDNKDNPNNGMEPYAVSNMYLGPESRFHKGYAPMSWITGTAGWLYRAITEGIVGITPSFDGLLVDPCLPSGFASLEVKRVFQGTTFLFHYRRGTTFLMKENGEEIKGHFLKNNQQTLREIEVFFD